MKRGMTVVELVLGAAIISLFFTSIYGYFTIVLRTSNLTTHYIQSAYLLEEGVEAVKSMRDLGYSTTLKNLDTTKTWSLHWDGVSWSATTTPEIIDGLFTRTMKIEKAYRNGTSDLATSGTEDVDTKKITIYVQWQVSGGNMKRVNASTYVQNIFQN